MKILGFTDEITCCDRCGKMNLRGTFVIEDADRTIYLGSDCVKKAYQMTKKEVTAKVSADTNEQKKLAREEYFGLSSELEKNIKKMQDESRGKAMFLIPEYVELCDKVQAIKKDVLTRYPLVTWL